MENVKLIEGVKSISWTEDVNSFVFDVQIPREMSARDHSFYHMSGWQQYFVSASPHRAEGWTMRGCRLLYGVDGGPVTNALARAVSDATSFRVTRHWRDAFGRENRQISLRMTRDNGATWDETTWTYDDLTGLLLAKTYADGSQMTYTYTPDGQPARTTYPGGNWNLIHETVTSFDANSTTNVTEIEYFWGPDLSDTLQGAGGVGGLLAVSQNGQYYFPVYDNNGNIVKYVDESGSIVVFCTYDDFGRMLTAIGPLVSSFYFLFSTKYFDLEANLYYYGYRFYSPLWRRWLNRDYLDLNP